MDEFKIWALEDASSVVELESQRQMEAESLLEDTLVANPDLLMPGLKLVGRQTPTAGGPLDLLGVDRYGRLSLFELKRGTLTRDAVAQVIDYAADLEAMDLAELAALLARESGERGIDEIEDLEWYGQRFAEPHASPYFCRHQITPKTSRYTRCSMSMLPNVSINRRIRSSGQLGRWWYSISPCRNNECVRRFTVFAFNQRS